MEMESVAETMIDHDTVKLTALACAGWLLQILPFTYDVLAKSLTVVGLFLYIIYLGYSIWCKRLELKQRRAAMIDVLEDDSEDPNVVP
ncbi:hypothetical protein ACAW74_18140 [Fibrella sp. WM1]|uniref:hypothetical protein n=1 Tax=Fibrella musci TaxID=3242485 RepID=UPI00351F820C